MEPGTIGNTQQDSRCMSYYELISINWVMVDFSSIKLDLSARYWKPQGWSIAMGFQHPTRLVHLLEHRIMVLRLIDIGKTNMIMS